MSARWQEFATQAPDMAERVKARFSWTKHHVIATLRKNGAPRVSGTEVEFHGPDLTIGLMWGSVKARDLQRDGRYALHSNPGDSSMQGGDAKISGVAQEVVDQDELQAFVLDTGAPQPFHLFRLTISEAVLTSVDPSGEFLLIESWRPGQPVVRIERR
ncbi:MAG: pyridoxamine 5'-phosphate oxidase family protein [Actinomycetota bacterium]|nr:pyridoxamine 5'-phosphate oxidase family protein [Actinomycetota bacterium]